MSSKNPTSASNIRNLIFDIKKIELDCLGELADDGSDKKDSKLDVFTAAKKNLTIKLAELKQTVKQRNDLVERVKRNEMTIRLGNENGRLMDQCTRHLEEMKTALEKDKKRSGKKALEPSTLEERAQLIALFVRDVADVQRQHNGETSAAKLGAPGGPGGLGSGGFTAAREAREARRKAREQRRKARQEGSDPTNDAPDDIEMSQMQPLSQQEQMFIQECNTRDEQIDAKLDQIHEGVKVLGHIATDIQTELKVQDKMLDDVTEKMDDTLAKYKNANTKIKDLLQKTGGMSRWCPIIITLIILLGLGAYAYNMMNEDEDADKK